MFGSEFSVLHSYYIPVNSSFNTLHAALALLVKESQNPSLVTKPAAPV